MYILQGIAILANECPKSYAGVSIMLMLIDCHTQNSGKLSERYIVQGIAILANEHLEPQKQGYVTKCYSLTNFTAVSYWFHAKFALCPLGTGKLLLTGTISLANLKNLVESLTHARTSLCSLKHGYLSLQKYSLTFPTPVLRLKAPAADFTA